MHREKITTFFMHTMSSPGWEAAKKTRKEKQVTLEAGTDGIRITTGCSDTPGEAGPGTGGVEASVYYRVKKKKKMRCSTHLQADALNRHVYISYAGDIAENQTVTQQNSTYTYIAYPLTCWSFHKTEKLQVPNTDMLFYNTSAIYDEAPDLPLTLLGLNINDNNNSPLPLPVISPLQQLSRCYEMSRTGADWSLGHLSNAR